LWAIFLRRLLVVSFEGGFLLFLGMMLVVLPVSFVLPRLVNWIVGRRLLPTWLPFVIAPGALLGGSLYLDSAGVVTPVKVAGKREVIDLRRNGGWSRILSIGVEYQAPGETLTTPLTLGCDDTTFDSIRIGQSVEARVLDLGQYVRFARLKDRSTFSFIRNLFPPDPRGPWRQGTAVVRQITHITEYSYRRSGHRPLRWPYDIVQLDFTPEGRSEPVIAVDLVESGSAINLAQGAVMRISWPEDDPRSAKIVGARPAAPWANWFYSMFEWIAFFVAVIAFIVVVSYLWRLRKKSKLKSGMG
jgi:hypothetical protein